MIFQKHASCWDALTKGVYIKCGHIEKILRRLEILSSSPIFIDN